MKTSASIGFALLVMSGAASPAAAYPEGERCIVDLPQGPARVHRWPQGPVMDKLHNGDVVVIHDLIRDSEGYLWADISNADVGPAWIYRQHVKCE
jgi:hypothetical protein